MSSASCACRQPRKVMHDDLHRVAAARRRRRRIVLWCTAWWLLGVSAAARGQDPFADVVVSFTPGRNAGFGADHFPQIVLGPPVGAGDAEGSLDVLSLGDGGSIVLQFTDNVICDGPGPDFTVFENAFYAGGTGGPVFADVGIVAVSQDGVHFVEFPYDATSLDGLAGKTPVYSSPGNGIDPTDPTVSGGDTFDLATVGLAWAAYVRITDPGAAIPDPGNRVPGGNNAGFDLDAIAAVHSCGVGTPSSTPSATPTPTASPSGADATPTVTAELSATATQTPEPPHATLTPTATPSNAVPSTTPTVAADLNGDGLVDGRDIDVVIAAIFGDPADACSSPDVNHDGVITAADCAAVSRLAESGAR
jgi:hypothetical protein